MSERSYSEISCAVIDRAQPSKEVTFYVGDVFNHQPTSQDAFMSTVVIGFTKPDNAGDVYALVARPYAYAHGIGSSRPRVLVGYEQYEIPVQHIIQHWTRVGTNNVQGGFETIPEHPIKF